MATTRDTDKLQTEIERTLARSLPEVEVVLAERPSPGLLRVYIDREQGGVDLELCEQVSRELKELRDRYALEVSSPGLERPLTKPAHFVRAVGSTVAVRTAEPIGGRRHFNARLVAAGEQGLELDQDGVTVTVPYAAIRRSHLVAESAGGRS
jgi:ribosome maturation factor RimP